MRAGRRCVPMFHGGNGTSITALACLLSLCFFCAAVVLLLSYWHACPGAAVAFCASWIPTLSDRRLKHLCGASGPGLAGDITSLSLCDLAQESIFSSEREMRYALLRTPGLLLAWTATSSGPLRAPAVPSPFCAALVGIYTAIPIRCWRRYAAFAASSSYLHLHLRMVPHASIAFAGIDTCRNVSARLRSSHLRAASRMARVSLASQRRCAAAICASADIAPISSRKSGHIAPLLSVTSLFRRAAPTSWNFGRRR